MPRNQPLLLPVAFLDLEQFVSGWADETANARERKRHESTMVEIAEFYAAMTPRLEQAFAHLDDYDLHSLPRPEATLLRLTFGYIETALVIEILKTREVPGAPYPHGFSITREFL